MIVIIYAMAMVRVVSDRPIVNPIVGAVIVFLTSLAFYRLLVELLYKVVGAVPLFMRLYWGRLWVAGLWSYTYTLEGVKDDTVYFGVWRFEQTLYATMVVGFGLTDDFRVRSRVRSVTELIGAGPMYEFVNIRTDSVDPDADYYSRTTMYFELNKNRIFRYPARMRGTTIMYGGPRTGIVCNNVFIRHEDAKTEEDVIEELRKNMAKYGKVHPGDLDRRAPPQRQPPAGQLR
jgi:hypothetical protein